jgi:signal transduction histidine kinase
MVMAGLEPVLRAVDVAEFIRQHREAILQNWEAHVRTLSVAQSLPAANLIGKIPLILDALIEAIEERALGLPWEEHAAQRMKHGYCLAEVVSEYTALRASILEHLDQLGLAIPPDQNLRLNRAIDEAIRSSGDRFIKTTRTMLRATERIAAQGTPTRTLDETFQDILQALREAVGAAVDSVGIFLSGDDGRLYLRATIGLEDEKDAGFSLAIGEGFAGTIAATGEPNLLRDAANDPLVVSPGLRHRGTKGLYGIALRESGRSIGVIEIGSRTASEFSEEDALLFRAIAERATTAILRAQFVEMLERTARFREQFVGVLAHDLRSPLTAILGTSQHLLSSNEPGLEVARPALARITRCATRMNQLIAQLLDFTRARLGGGFPLTVTTFSLRDLARDVADEHTPLLSRRNLAVEGDAPVMGTWDRERIAQVLSNLIGNAIQHSPDGARIRVYVHEDGPTVGVVDVWNEGPPIPPGTKLVEPFMRGTSGNGGLGLGLYITDQIVRAHQGTLALRSDATGTTFTVCLPVRTSRSGHRDDVS